MSEPTDASFENRPLPEWYDDAKLGIFVHWGICTVPAWAPKSGPIWDPDPDAPKLTNFAQNPYAEWYANTMRIDGSPTQAYHAKTYGADFPYARFAETFNREIAAWDPDEWANLFARAGARYAVLTTKHHDGFLLWPSAHRNPRAPDFVASRDIVGELTDAVRARGLRMGLYYSGGIDWLYHDQVIASLGDLIRAIPMREDYRQYATSHWRELIERFQPCSMWNDIAFPASDAEIEELFAFYYTHVPDGVVNDRFRKVLGPDGLASGVVHDVQTPEYEVVRDIVPKKWESVRGIGNSFGYNREEGEGEYLSGHELIRLFVDIVSKNGNLLLNVGPRADGSIPELQVEPLLALGDWLEVNGEAIYGTRPWTHAEGRTADGLEVRFTRKGDVLHAIVLGAEADAELVIEDVAPTTACSVELIGSEEPLQWSQEHGRLHVALPPTLPSGHAVALRIEE
jgi:alpha-L-fucosidase